MPYFHIINANAGFVILSPDSVYRPILAYDTLGNFSFEKPYINPGILMWLNKHAYEIDYIRNHKNTTIHSIANSNKSLWNTIGILTNQNNNNSGRQVDVPPPTLISSVPAYYQTNSTIGPLCNTLWGQLFPFNYDCPANNDPTEGDHMPVGCVEVAMGQIMHFWQHPSNYNWSIMPLTLESYLSLPAYNNSEAQLLSDIGTTSGPVFIQAKTGFSTTQFADYTDGNTKSDDTFCPFVFGVFGYSSASRTETISDQVLSGAKNGTAYAGLLTNEIQTYRRPCMVGGYSGENDILGIYWPYSDGHEWVCDGSNVTTYYSGTTNTYKSFYGVITTQTTYTSSQTVSLLHMNWGWVAPAGETDLYGNYLTNNGWYDCSVNYSQADAQSLNFGYFQTVIYQIHP